MSTIYLSLGSNIKPKENLKRALEYLRQYYKPMEESKSVRYSAYRVI